MIQANLIKPFEINLEEVEEPFLPDDKIKIRIEAVGICGSDVQMYHGLHKYMTFPVVIGHEIGGVVAETGKNVTGFQVGERVTVQPQCVCHKCCPCQIGRFNVCENLKVMGVHKNGMACNYYIVDPWNVHKCPQDLKAELAALVEPLAVGVGAVKRAENYKGANIVVVGAGTIGNLTAQAAKALGAGQVMITDISEDKLETARRCGLNLAVNTKDISLKDTVIEHFGVQKADIIIDCAASRSSFESILAAARPSSKIIVTGNYKQEMQLELPVLQRQEISLIGHMMYVKEDFSDAIAFLSEGKIQTDDIISRVFPITRIRDAFQYIDDNTATVMKVIVKMEEEEEKEYE